MNASWVLHLEAAELRVELRRARAETSRVRYELKKQRERTAFWRERARTERVVRHVYTVKVKAGV